MKDVFYLHPISADILHGRSAHTAGYERKILYPCPLSLQGVLHKAMPVLAPSGPDIYMLRIFPDNFYAPNLIA